MTEYGLWVIVMSVFALACSLLMDILGRSNSTRCLQCVWPLMIFVLPLSFLWIPFLKAAYEQVPSKLPWCTIRTVNEDCSDFKFGQAFYYALNAPLFVLSFAVLVIYFCAVFIIFRRRRQRIIHYDAYLVEQRKQLEKETATFTLLILVFFVGIIFSAVAVIFTGGGYNVFAVWVPFAAYSPAGIVSLLLTVDKQALNGKSLFCLFKFRPKRNITEYAISVESNSSIFSSEEMLDDKIAYHPLFDK